jgi:hypothetical protein
MPERIEKPIRVKELERRFKPRDPREQTPITLERRFPSPPRANRRSRRRSLASTEATAERSGRWSSRSTASAPALVPSPRR